ncbi:MAG TPA: ABC transporter permease [Acidocella sp.]|jgi:sulfonate transport system permease protein|uniref:ABC transporter permease n=1 Tax=Acidocella sp. TaxID=50710 RepID=UPI002B664C31|nr:ABC transporter permease [Acidocella sp.]HVE22962.1 ABC transporter permease [Acidocella sp.]
MADKVLAPSAAEFTAAGRDAMPVAAGTWRWPLGIILPAICIFAWQLVAGLGWVGPDLLPSPLTVPQTIVGMARDGTLWIDIGATAHRLAFGFLFGAAAATLAGALTGAFAYGRRLLDPMLQALRNVPSLAWVPLFIIWFGIYDVSKILLIAVGVFFPVYLNLMNGIAGVDRKLIEVGRVHGYGRLALLLRVQLPASLPAYLTGLRGGLGLGWMFVASAEMMGASNGLGFILTNGEEVGRPDQVIAAIFAFALLGKATDWVLAQGARRLIAWQDTITLESGRT